jgi:hypothetical protein
MGNQLDDVDRFFEGGDDFGPQARSARWGKTGRNDRCKPGMVEKGIIVEDPFPLQQRAYKADGSLGEPKFWNKPGTKEPDPDKPMMQLKVIIATDHKDDPEDDGRRAVFIKGPLYKAVKEVLKETGAKLRKGGWLAVKCTGLELSGEFDAYTWEVKYVPPPPASDEFFNDEMAPPAPTQETKVAEKVAERRSTLAQIQASGHQASLRPNDGFDDEPPF